MDSRGACIGFPVIFGVLGLFFPGRIGFFIPQSIAGRQKSNDLLLRHVQKEEESSGIISLS